MKILSSTKKKIAAVAVASAVIASSGLAYAYWTQSGSGAGSATTGTTTSVTVNQTSDASDFYPGMTEVTLSGDFDNPNAGPVKVGSVTATLGTLPTGCVAADFTIGGTAVVDAEIPSGDAQGSWTGLTIKMNNTAVNQDACKVKTIPLVLAVSAAS